MSSFFPKLGFGLGLRSDHYEEILSGARRPIDWFEALSENYMPLDGPSGEQGPAPGLVKLEKIRADYPIVLHGVSMSIGSSDPLNLNYLRKLKQLVDRVEPAWFSDHLCWTGVDGQNLHDLMPLPYTEETIRHVVERILRVQEFMGRRMLIENVSSYLEYRSSEMPEWEFVAEIARRADCGILLDVNNIYVSSRNHGFDPEVYLGAMPVERIGQIHLAGHSDAGTHLVDTHDEPVPEAVWKVYEQAVRRFGSVSAMIERDDNIPELEELEAEVARARSYV